MKLSLAAGALCATLLLPAIMASHSPRASRAWAQPAATEGYALILQARELLLPGPNGSPSAAETLSPAEDLRRQRLAVARNAPALAKTRAALQLSIAIPLPDAATGMEFIRTNAALRELARQFAQESDVRAADGDAWGAAQSSFDAIELGAQTSLGSTIQWLVGSAVSSIGRKYLLKHAPLLNAAQARQVAARWERIEAARPTLEAVLRAQEESAFQYGRVMLQDPAARAAMQTNLLKPDAADSIYTHAELRQLLALSVPQLRANLSLLFAQAIERSRQPYQFASQQQEFRGADPLSEGETLTLNYVRFGYERNNLSARLGIAALRLRATRLESGAFPTTFDAGADPFSPALAPLVYRRVGESYLLYSVGPDGADDGGAVEKLADGTNVGGRVRADTTGDVVAPVL